MEHAPNIIDDLGGYKKVAEQLGQNETTVANWRTRGVPWRWRPAIADLARRNDVAVPDDFFRPQVA